MTNDDPQCENLKIFLSSCRFYVKLLLRSKSKTSKSEILTIAEPLIFGFSGFMQFSNAWISRKLQIRVSKTVKMIMFDSLSLPWLISRKKLDGRKIPKFTHCVNVGREVVVFVFKSTWMATMMLLPRVRTYEIQIVKHFRQIVAKT